VSYNQHLARNHHNLVSDQLCLGSDIISCLMIDSFIHSLVGCDQRVSGSFFLHLFPGRSSGIQTYPVEQYRYPFPLAGRSRVVVPIDQSIKLYLCAHLHVRFIVLIVLILSSIFSPVSLDSSRIDHIIRMYVCVCAPSFCVIVGDCFNRKRCAQIILLHWLDSLIDRRLDCPSI